MSNLLKALKRAEQDREAARQTRAQTETGATPAPATPSEPLVEAGPSPDQSDGENDIARPAVMRSQRDAVKASERITPHTAAPRAPAKTYRGVGIALILATLFALGLGLSLRGRDADKPSILPTIAAKSTAPLPTTIPTALLMSEAGPLQLRLDRSVDAIGEIAHRRNKLQ